MSKQHITAEEKHYIKLNKKLQQKLNVSEAERRRLCNEVFSLNTTVSKMQDIIQEQQVWIKRLRDCVKMSPEEFNLWVQDIRNQTQLELDKQENLKSILKMLSGQL